MVDTVFPIIYDPMYTNMAKILTYIGPCPLPGETIKHKDGHIILILKLLNFMVNDQTVCMLFTFVPVVYWNTCLY